MLVFIETFAELEEVNGDKDQRLIMCTWKAVSPHRLGQYHKKKLTTCNAVSESRKDKIHCTGCEYNI